MKQKCPICLNNEIIRQDKKLSLFYCKPCNHRFAVIETQNQEKYTPEYFFDMHRNWFKNPNYKLFDYILRQLPKKKIKLLDIGCGNGAFLKYVLSKRKNIELYGIDLIKNNHTKIKFINGNLFNTVITEKFDVVISLSTIEHIDKQRKFAQILKNLVKKNGIIFINTIDSDALIYRIAENIKQIWRTPYDRLYDLAHLNHFTKKSLKKLMEIENFEIIHHINHNPSLKAIDVPNANFILMIFYKATAMSIYLLSSLIKRQVFQTIVCKK